MSTQAQILVIQGLTKAGKQFRPSDWVDRMCSSFATFGEDRKLRYSPYLKPIVMNGVRCLEIDMQLKTRSPERFQELMEFVSENNLNVVDEAGNTMELA